MSKNYKNSHQLRDGAILLFNRVGAQKPVWHARIKKPGSYPTASQRYLSRSMKTVNYAEAAMAAEDILDDLRYKYKNDIPLETLKLAKLYEMWKATVGIRKNKGRMETIRKAYDLYLLPYFEKTNITDIKPGLVTKFWDWRLDYWVTGEGSKTESCFVGNVPKLSTVKQERQCLKQILKWAVEQDLLHKMPEISVPELASTEEDDSIRPAFTMAEYNRLNDYFDDEYLPKRNEDIKEFWARNPKLNSSHLYGRRMLVNFMRVGIYSGLRPHELLLLKWKHVEHYKFGGEQNVKFNVPKNTKTGARQNVCQPACIKFLSDLKEHSLHTSDEDYLFNTEEGGKAPSPRLKLNRVLKKMKMKTDVFGNPFVPYSVRHTYITFRLLYGDVSIDDLARNVGTSTEMINTHYDHVLNEQKTEILTSTKRQKK